MDYLNIFFNKVKEIGFWERLFGWRSIKTLSYDAFQEFRALETQINQLKASVEQLERKNSDSIHKIDHLTEQRKDDESDLSDKRAELKILTEKINLLNEQNHQLKLKINQFENSITEKDNEYKKNITQITQLKHNLDDDRKRISEDRLKEQKEEFERMKEVWREHEDAVRQRIKMICQIHLVKYVDKVPFRGDPDNTIEICDEFIIFDAKSPANDDLNNFPKYIKAQTEAVNKYVEQERVKRDIYLVIPTNTYQVIEKVVYNMADYTVYVVTLDSLEPIILSLKKIEDYEFADQLSPDERDDICRVIGKFAHTAKRRIQIDQFFNNQFLELLLRCESDLPDDILKEVIEIEKAEKLNPPSEKRTKQILLRELTEKSKQLSNEALNQNIVIPMNFGDIKKL
ncbi:MAG: hypothetical protein KDD94_05945, partial [Calditrichaeota bacterium]|nr:hypothetical protein [Calditrichota bacterium]